MSVLAVHFSSALLRWISQSPLHLPFGSRHGLILGCTKWDFFLVQLKWKLLSGISPSELQLWMGAPQEASTVNLGSSAPSVSLCGTALPRGTAVAADKGRALESPLSVPSEHCPSLGRRAVASGKLEAMLLQRARMLFTRRASVPYTCLIAEVVLTPSNRQAKYFILNGFRVVIFDRFNNRTLPN